MEPITYLNIQVEGVTFTRLLSLEIKHNVNEHGVANISGEMSIEAAQDYMNRADEKTAVKISTTAQGQPKVLFYGVATSVGMQKMSNYAVVQLVVTSTSVLLDYEKKNKSYQNTSKTYEEIMTQAVAGQAMIQMQVTDRATGSIIVLCNETAWEFCKRMASRLNAPVITSINAQVPVFTIGIPKRGKTYPLADVELHTESGNLSSEGFMAQDMLGTNIKTTQYMFLGEAISLGSGNQKVSGISATLKSGMLISTVCISTEKSFAQPTVSNTQISGKMYTGVVQAVQKDQVQVHLVDIDSEYDAGGNVWLPYSTAYSSSDGSGFYCMPAVGDQVRVFFPGSNEGEAFAASSVSVNSAPEVTDKQWTGPEGKQILMTKEGIYITTNANDNKIFINLTDKDGITISSNKNITICAKKNLSLISNDTININAENDILISSAESYIDIKPEGIELGAENVVIK